MLKKSLIALALAGSVFAAGCGGGSSSSSPSEPETTARNDVAGPLDAVQEPVSSQVIAPLASAAAGTPLQGVVECVDQVVVGDALDLVDSLAAQAQAGATSFTGAAANVQAELTDLVADLQSLLVTLADPAATGCSGTAVPNLSVPSTNPLAGTPLEAFGATVLSALSTAQAALSGGASAPDLSALSGIIGQLSDAYQMALSNVPESASSAPIVGPALGLVGQALSDLDATVTAAANSGGDPTATTAALAATLENLLTGLLLDVVPVNAIETASGQEGALSGPIQMAIDQLTGALSTGLGGAGGGDLVTTLTGEITTVLDTLGAGAPSDPASLLQQILAPLTDAIQGGATGGVVVPVTGLDMLDTVLASLTELLAGAGAGGSPLAGLISTLQDLLGGLLGG